MLLPGLGFSLHCAVPWHFGDFRYISLPNEGESQKKSYHRNAEALALCPVVVTVVLKVRVPVRSTGSVEQPIELLCGLT